MYLDDHSWQVAYILSIEPLVIQQQLVHRLLREAKTVVGNTESFNTETKFLETLKDLERNLETSVINLNALTARDSCRETRQRRGIVSIGGKILRLLFGVLDWKVVQKVNDLENVTKGVVHALEKHISVLKDTHDVLLDQSVKIDQAWDLLMNNVTIELSYINQRFQWNDLCNLIQSIIGNLHASIFRLQMRVQNWQSGRLSTSVLGKEFLLNITREIERQSRRNFHFDLITAKISAIEFCQNRYEVSMIISVPEDLAFTLYEVTELPLYSESKDKFLVIDLPEYIAISNGKNVELSAHMFNEECYSFHTHYSCPQGVSPVRSNAQSCANSLVLSTDVNRTLELCEHRFDTIAHPTLQLVRDTNAVKYILPRPTNCKLTCMLPGQRIERLSTFSLHGSGLYQIPENCSLNIDDLETFYSRRLLYYNESFLVYNHTNAQNLLNRAILVDKKSSPDSIVNSENLPSVPQASQELNILKVIIICIISSIITLIICMSAIVPLYMKLYCVDSRDREFRLQLGL